MIVSERVKRYFGESDDKYLRKVGEKSPEFVSIKKEKTADKPIKVIYNETKKESSGSGFGIAGLFITLILFVVGISLISPISEAVKTTQGENMPSSVSSMIELLPIIVVITLITGLSSWFVTKE